MSRQSVRRFSYKKSRFYITTALILSFIPFLTCFIGLFYNAVQPFNSFISLGIIELLYLIPMIISLISFIKTMEYLKKHNLNTSKNMMILTIISIFLHSLNCYYIFGYLLKVDSFLLYLNIVTLVIMLLTYILYRNYWLFGSVYHEMLVAYAKFNNLSDSIMNEANLYDSSISFSSYSYRKIKNIRDRITIDALTQTNCSTKNRLCSLLIPLLIYCIVALIIYCIHAEVIVF